MSKWFLEQRLNFIQEHLKENGEINRKTIMEKFDVSVAVASHDLKKYQDKNPNAIHYDKQIKKYLVKT
jgi:DeoR/GlpR family transcriptional regulator of sugar metabolism